MENHVEHQLVDSPWKKPITRSLSSKRAERREER